MRAFVPGGVERCQFGGTSTCGRNTPESAAVGRRVDDRIGGGPRQTARRLSIGESHGRAALDRNLQDATAGEEDYRPAVRGQERMFGARRALHESELEPVERAAIDGSSAVGVAHHEERAAIR